MWLELMILAVSDSATDGDTLDGWFDHGFKRR